MIYRADFSIQNSNYAYSRLLPSLFTKSNGNKKNVKNLNKVVKHVRFPSIIEKESSNFSLSLNSLDNLFNKSIAYRSILYSYKKEWDDTKKNSFLEKLILFLDQREHYFMLCYIDVIC